MVRRGAFMIRPLKMLLLGSLLYSLNAMADTASPDVDAILDQAAQAMGTAHLADLPAFKMESAQTLTIKKVTYDPVKGQTLVDTASGQFKSTFIAAGITLISGHDSAGGWNREAEKRPVRMEGEEKTWSSFDAFLYSGAALNSDVRIANTYRWLRVEDCGSSACDVMKPKGKDAPDVEIWFRRDTHLIDRAVLVSTKAADRSWMIFKQWVTVKGVLLPAAYTYHDRSLDLEETATYTPVPAGPLSDLQMPDLQDWAFTDGADHAVVPFKLDHDTMEIPVAINGRPGYNLQFDTGADFVIKDSAIKPLHLKTTPSGSHGGMGGSETEAGISEPVDISMGNLQLKQWRATTLDMGRMEGWGAQDEHWLGLIGSDLLERFVVKVDFDRSELWLYRPGTYQYQGSSKPITLTSAFGRLAIPAQVEGDWGSFLVDTGDEGNLTLNAPFVRSHNLFNRLRCTRERVLAEGVGGQVFGRRASIETFTLDGVSVPSFGADLVSMRKGITASDTIAGVLGLGILRRFNLTIDLPEKRIYLERNSHFHDADTSPVSMAELL